MKILFINTSTPRRKYGGRAYDEMTAKSLSDDFEIETVNVYPRGKKLRYFKLPLIVGELFKLSKRQNIDFVIKDFTASLFLNRKPVKNIAAVHHIDDSYAPFLVKAASFFLQPIILSKLKKFDTVVVVSQYWKEYLRKRGFKNVTVIHNAFDPEKFKFSLQEIEDFRKKYNLTGKPIVYLGNCQEAKGVLESYQALKNLNVHLVTSASPQVEIPAKNLEVPHRDYLRLLKASVVVIAMSKFKEGWCRTAHEAMLCKTPVIGSGLGGMKELLEGGKQIVCPSFDTLEEKVDYLLNNPEVREKMGEAGFNFAKSFTFERFKRNWQELIERLGTKG